MAPWQWQVELFSMITALATWQLPKRKSCHTAFPGCASSPDRGVPLLGRLWTFPGAAALLYGQSSGHDEPVVAGSAYRCRLPRWLRGKTNKQTNKQTKTTCQCRRRGFYSWVGKIPWRRKRQPTPVFLPGESHGQRSLVGYSP